MMSWLRNNKHLVCFRFDARRAGKIFGGRELCVYRKQGHGSRGARGAIAPSTLCLNEMDMPVPPTFWLSLYRHINPPPPKIKIVPVVLTERNEK